MTHPHINISRPRRHFSRTAAGPRTLCTYGLVDDISLSWKGPRLDRADDDAEDCTLSIATDFSEKARRDGEYAYDPDGRLTRDSNKGVTVSYNILGLPSLVCDGVNRIRRTYDSQGTLLRAEYGTERIEFTSPEPGQVGAIVATPVFDLARVADRCGPVEYADHAVERYIHEAGWIDSHGRHVAAVRDCRGSLRATWTAHSALPPTPDNGNSNNTNSNNTNGNPSASGNNGSSLTLPGPGIGQVLPAGNVYADLTAYYPFGLPFADWQGASRDLFSGKELERSGNLLDYDFHARRLDPQLLIFDKPDPLAANYPNLNPYLYCAANPISLTDPSGMLFTTIMENLMGNLEQEVTFVEREALFDGDIAKAVELGRFKIGIRQARESSQVYDYTPEKSDQKDVFGATYFDASTGKVFISDCTYDGEFSIDRFGHEAMHVVQFEQGKISFGAKENRAMYNLSNQYPGMSHGLLDIIDEYEAYRIQSLLETPKRQFEKALMPYDIEHNSQYINYPREYIDVHYLYNRSGSLPVNVIPNFKKLADDYKFAFRYKGQTFKP